jgi:hypothetical protein
VQNLGPAEGAWQMQEREEGEMSGGFERPDSLVGGPMKMLTRGCLRYDWTRGTGLIYLYIISAWVQDGLDTIRVLWKILIIHYIMNFSTAYR